MKKIKKVGVVGSGTMGSAITQFFVMKGIETTMVDLSSDCLNRGLKNIEKSLDEAVERRIISKDKQKIMMKGLTTSIKYSDLENCDLIVEAVFEDLKVKKDLFNELEKHVSNECILASNTSSFSITDLGCDLRHPERFIGVHYFFHAAKNKLIEIIPGKKTEINYINLLSDFYSFYEKCPIIVGDVPGFAVNRFFVPWLNEAVRLHEEGIASIDLIDRIAKEVFNIGMGPFALMNATGVPIAMHAAQTLADKFGDFYTPANSLKEQVLSGCPWEIQPQLNDSFKSEPSDQEKIIKERLLASALGVAAQMVSEGVTDATSTDLGARLGLRWPKGPFELMNELGISSIKSMVNDLFSKYDLPLPTVFDKLNIDGEISLDFVQTQIINDIGFIEFNRPDSLNSLNELVMSQLEQCFLKLENNSKIKKIILTGKGKAFVAGADIKFFVENIKSKNLNKIYSFTKKGQDLFKQIANSTKETYSYLDGLVLGGGLELALCTNYRVGTKNTIMAFPETGIGIYPGLGGTQRTTELIGKGLAKYLIATGDMVHADNALDMGLLDIIIKRPWSRNELIQSLDDVSNSTDVTTLPQEEFSLFNGEISEKILQKLPYKNYEKALRKKAPLALKKAMELVEEGSFLDLDKGLELELDSLNWIFSTKDALVGLESIIERKRPEFFGE